MNKTIKWGILGTSAISEVMAEAIQESVSSELVAVGSRSGAKAQSFSEKFSIPRYYDHYEQLLADRDIDAVYIGLPNHVHKEWIIRCAQAGKHILCEKPFVVSSNEAREAIAAVRQAHVFCMEGLMYKHHPFTSKINEIIQSKVLGEIKLYNATYTAPIADIANPTAGGSIRNLGCYPVSLVRLLAKAEPVDLCASGRINPISNLDNQASAILTFEDQAMAVISTADDMAMTWHFEVYGSKGVLKAITNPWLPNCDENKLAIQLHEEAIPEEINITATQSLYSYQIDAVNQCILNRTHFDEATLLDSLGNTVILEQWLRTIMIL